MNITVIGLGYVGLPLAMMLCEGGHDVCGYDWEEAVAVDKAVRHMRIGEVFLHPSRMPLDEVDFRTAEEMGQLSLWDNECEGMCGL